MIPLALLPIKSYNASIHSVLRPKGLQMIKSSKNNYKSEKNMALIWS